MISKGVLQKLIALDLPSGKLKKVVAIVDAALRERKPAEMPVTDGWPADYREQFRKLYPRNAAMAAALPRLDQIARSGEVQWPRFLAGLERHARACRGKDERYVAHPSTWLNQARWDDGPLAEVNGTSVSFDPRKITADEWRRVLERAYFDHRSMATSHWNSAAYGPEPGHPGCIVPPELLGKSR